MTKKTTLTRAAIVSLTALALSFVAGAVPVHAQKRSAGLKKKPPAVAKSPSRSKPGAVQYKKETRYDFDDDLVEGELQRPDGDLIAGQRKTQHSSLIKIRQDFIPEILKSAEDL